MSPSTVAGDAASGSGGPSPVNAGIRAGAVAGAAYAVFALVVLLVRRDAVVESLEAALAGTDAGVGLDPQLLYWLTVATGPWPLLLYFLVGGAVVGLAARRVRPTPVRVGAASIAFAVLTALGTSLPLDFRLLVGVAALCWLGFAALFVRSDAGTRSAGGTRPATTGAATRRVYPRLAAVLVAGGTAGVAALLGVQLAVGADLAAVQLAVGLLANAALVAGAVVAGLYLRRPLPLAAPYLDAWLAGDRLLPLAPLWRLALPLGAAAGGAVVALDAAVFAPFVEAAVRDTAATPVAGGSPLANAPLVLYGGVTEELLLRLGLMTALAWVAWRLAGREVTAAGMWTAVVVAAVAFGLAHLPATAAVLELTPVVVARALVLNGLGGVAFGWLYWRRGLEAAMVAHAAADVALVVVLPAVAGLV